MPVAAPDLLPDTGELEHSDDEAYQVAVVHPTARSEPDFVGLVDPGRLQGLVCRFALPVALSRRRPFSGKLPELFRSSQLVLGPGDGIEAAGT